MRKSLISAALATAAVVGTAGTALAVSGASSPSNTISGCLTKARTVVDVHRKTSSLKCPKGDTLIRWNVNGPAGPAGAKGATGAQGPSGVVSTNTTDLGTVASVPTGGGFAANATQVGTISLKAGTYLLNVNAKATPNASSAIEVFPQFFVYDQPANSSFTGDLFNVGSGPLASNNTTIDSYFSGSGEVTLTSDATLHVYAFGYDSDRSAGTYKLDDLSVTATRINAGS
jgi:hypothetical protein